MGNYSQEHFLKLTTRLMALPKTSTEIPEIVTEMAGILASVTGVSAEDDINSKEYVDIETDGGVAISPVKAAKCLKEYWRTYVFLKGTQQAIHDALKRTKRVNILYAGSGPFGSIVLPLILLFPAGTIQLTILDIHQLNVDCVTKLVKWLGVEETVHTIKVADATTWQPESDDDIQQYDLIVSETMNTFLKREPQVCIFANLEQFLAKDGEFIPEQVETSFAIQKTQSEKKGDYEFQTLSPLFVLDRQQAKLVREQKLRRFPYSVVMPETAESYRAVALNTDIRVYRDNILTLRECSLTMPVLKTGLAVPAGSHFKLTYYIDIEPFWEFDIPNLYDQLAPYSSDFKGELDICHLGRFWDRMRRLALNIKLEAGAEEHENDRLVCELLNIEYFEALQYLMTEEPTFEQFESWLREFGNLPDSDKKERFNLRFVAEGGF